MPWGALGRPGEDLLGQDLAAVAAPEAQVELPDKGRQPRPRGKGALHEARQTRQQQQAVVGCRPAGRHGRLGGGRRRRVAAAPLAAASDRVLRLLRWPLRRRPFDLPLIMQRLVQRLLLLAAAALVAPSSAFDGGGSSDQGCEARGLMGRAKKRSQVDGSHVDRRYVDQLPKANDARHVFHARRPRQRQAR